jgi:Mrp family chromosome partitioning ATPase
MNLSNALTTAMTDLRALDDPFASEMNVIAIDANGNHGGASTSADKTYIFMTDEMETFEEAARLHVPLDS